MDSRTSGSESDDEEGEREESDYDSEDMGLDPTDPANMNMFINTGFSEGAEDLAM